MERGFSGGTFIIMCQVGKGLLHLVQGPKARVVGSETFFLAVEMVFRIFWTS